MLEQALTDLRVVEALRAYEAARPFVPQPAFVPVIATYSTSTNIGKAESGRA